MVGVRPGRATRRAGRADILCLSHLRWDFVYQRPQHLLTRLAATRRVFYVEEPVVDGAAPRLERKEGSGGVHVLVPHVPPHLGAGERDGAVRGLVAVLARALDVSAPVLWFYTPMALPLTRGITPSAIVYDCMDELSAFAGAPADMGAAERELLRCADLVFTGGHSLYEAKRDLHPRVHAFPSSVDVAHFARSRHGLPEPPDQRGIPGPRLGFFGVLDERFDWDLIAGVADARPDWHLVLVGPVVKVDPAGLPRRANLHYLGMRAYADLPAYIAGWDVALLPFARNPSTRFISPTKTPEYLAAGRPVVSTSIRDVVHPYGDLGLVHVADQVPEFVSAVEDALAGPRAGWLEEVDAFLARESWDRTVARMERLLDVVVESRADLGADPPANGLWAGSTA